VNDRSRRFWRSGEPFVWLTGGALALIMVAGLIGIILANALGFLARRDRQAHPADGKTMAGVDRERIPAWPGTIASR
jgi:ABC-type phosphate transport system auxiliary subunit